MGNLIKAGAVLIGGAAIASLVTFARYLGYEGRLADALVQHFLPWIVVIAIIASGLAIVVIGVRLRLQGVRSHVGAEVLPIHLDAPSRSRLRRSGASSGALVGSVAYLSVHEAGLAIWSGGSAQVSLGQWPVEGTTVAIGSNPHEIRVIASGTEVATVRALDSWILGYLNARESRETAARIMASLARVSTSRPR